MVADLAAQRRWDDMKTLKIPAAVLCALAAFAIFSAAACDAPVTPQRAAGPRQARDVPASVVRKGKKCLLNIPDRKHASDRPKGVGWCGESAIQAALLFHGAYVPQKAINRAGKPGHADLYSNEIPPALRNLGMNIQIWPGATVKMPLFIQWLRGRIASGTPVLAGVKIYPTEHPQWGLDHFVLVVGLDDGAVILNTTWQRQETLTLNQMQSTRKGLAFKNRYNSYYGIGIRGPAALGTGDARVRLFVQKEEGPKIAVLVKCEGLTRGAEYVLYKAPSHDKPPRRWHAFRAQGEVCGFHDTIDRARSVVYRCLPKAARPAKPAAATDADLKTGRALWRRMGKTSLARVSLADALKSLAKAGRVAIVADWAALAKLGVGKKTLLSVDFAGGPLSLMLWSVLLAADKTGRTGYAVENGAVAVSAEDRLAAADRR